MNLIKTLLVYIYPNGVWGMPNWSQYVDRFVSSYRATVDAVPHHLLVVANGDTLHSTINPFEPLPDIYYLQHDDSGWDCGAFVSAAKWAVKHGYEMTAFFTTSAYFARTGWLLRMSQIFKIMGDDNLYGSTASLDRNPHLRTTGFWCDPVMLTTYPYAVNSEEKRMGFEHGTTSLTWWASNWLCRLSNTRPMLVTWDRVYREHHWRDGKDIFRRGDQSNILVRDRHADIFDLSPECDRIRLSALADGYLVSEPQGVWDADRGEFQLDPLLLTKRT